MLSPLDGCSSIRMQPSSTLKIPFNTSQLSESFADFCFKQYVPSVFSVSIVSILGGNTPQYVPAMESKSILFSKTDVYSSALTESISASFGGVPQKIYDVTSEISKTAIIINFFFITIIKEKVSAMSSEWHHGHE